MNTLKRMLQVVRFIKMTGIFVITCAISTHVSAERMSGTSDLIDRLDRNDDGGLSLKEVPQQMKRLRDAFDIVDANGDGIISKEEFSSINARKQSGNIQSTPHQPQTKNQELVRSSPVFDGKGAKGIHSRMQQAISNKELPGAIVIFIQNGEVVFEEVYGYADIESGRPQRIDDLFNLGSTSKPLAMTTVMTQVAENKVKLDDAISKWNTLYENKKLVDGTQAKRSPTVREMMSHTSGTFSIKCGERRDLSLLYMFRHTLKESAEAIAEKPLSYQPGEGFCYGGPAMQVLSRTIEVITGQDFDELAKSKVFTPLEMKDTFYRTDKELSDRIAVIYDKAAGGGLKRSPRTRDPRGDTFILAPGGIFSTAKDLSRFLQMQLQGGTLDGQRILPEKLLHEMHHNQIGNNKMDFGDPSVGDRNSAALGKIEGYGLGWILDEIDEFGDARVFSHGGAWGTYIWGDVDAQLGAVLLTQTPLTNATPVWNDVLRIARATWGEEKLGENIDVWKPEVRQMGGSGQQYIDPEILAEESLMTYQASSGDIWVAKLDPANGMFVSADGKDMLMTKNALNVRQTYNGPEFGLDKNGWAVFFTKNENDTPQIWQSNLVNGKPQAKPLLSDTQRRQTVLASKNAQASSTALLYMQGKLGDGRFFWADKNNPALENSVVRLKEVDSPRWIDNTNKFVYAENEGSDAGQLKLTDIVTGKVQTITNDEGIKSFAYGWQAPEFDNDLLVLAMIDFKSVGIWRDTGQKNWQRIATLQAPEASRYKYFGSPEPFVFQGKSYVSFVLKDSNTRGRFNDSEVWIVSIDSSSDKRFERRVDDAQTPVMRSDPEVYIGRNEVYVYYNAVDKDKVYEIHRASTGLLTNKANPVSVQKSSLSERPSIKKVDCIDSASCPPIIIKHAPQATLRDGSLSMIRGSVDASIINDLANGTIYLAYTDVSTHDPAGATGSRKDISAGIALASSRDSGKTWEYSTALKPSISEKDPVTGKLGYASQEVSSLANGGGYWYLAYLRFHDPAGGGNNRKQDSFHIEIARAKSPDALASAKTVKLAGTLAATDWTDYRLSKLDPDLSGCSLWLDPELYFQNAHLYLIAVCIPYEGGTRRSEKSFYAVFDVSNKDSNFGKPHYIGKLGNEDDAARLGAKELSKGDLTRSRDGQLLFLVAPVFKGARFEEYTGCYVLEVESIDPPRLKRDADGNPVARVVITSSDSVPTAASCSYDANSDKGVVLTRREMLPSQKKLEWSLHATGIHP